MYYHRRMKPVEERIWAAVARAWALSEDETRTTSSARSTSEGGTGVPRQQAAGEAVNRGQLSLVNAIFAENTGFSGDLESGLSIVSKVFWAPTTASTRLPMASRTRGTQPHVSTYLWIYVFTYENCEPLQVERRSRPRGKRSSGGLCFERRDDIGREFSDPC